MPSGGWDNRWPRYRESVPLRVEGGIASSKQRGPMASSWWSRRFTEVLESYGLGGRMQRGRRYARTGQVLNLDVSPGLLSAAVQGSRRTPYAVQISISEPTESQWQAIDAAVAAKVGFAAHLLAGEVPPDLEEVFHSAGADLFPPTWSAVGSDCSCPDWGNPCKHIAAVLYVFADQLDTDPWLLLAWRGRTRDEIIDPLRRDARSDTASEEIAPWWPFAPGPLPSLGAPPALEPTTPDPADAVLDALEPLDVLVGKTPLADVLRPIYVRIVLGAPPD